MNINEPTNQPTNQPTNKQYDDAPPRRGGWNDSSGERGNGGDGDSDIGRMVGRFVASDGWSTKTPNA